MKLRINKPPQMLTSLTSSKIRHERSFNRYSNCDWKRITRTTRMLDMGKDCAWP